MGKRGGGLRALSRKAKARAKKRKKGRAWKVWGEKKRSMGTSRTGGRKNKNTLERKVKGGPKREEGHVLPK